MTSLRLIFILLCLVVPCLSQEKRRNFTMMTFNIWISGSNVENGTHKIANHIKSINPDVVGLQEVTDLNFLHKLMELMGEGWEIISSTFSYIDTAILTRHEIIRDSFNQVSRGLGVRLKIGAVNRIIHVWNLHLDYRSYGPYAAFNKLVTKESQIMAGEMDNGEGRFQNIRELLVDEGFQDAVKNSAKEPLIVCGDFNAPSHLDWTTVTKHLHGDWEFEWPATKMLQDETQLKDSYRELHPNVLKDPGVTWSTVEKMTSAGWGWTIPEPQDRIDFIFYRSPLLQPVQSYTYQGHKTVYPKPFHQKNDYPSDHFAVITNFLLM